jgi:hypothetical protein
MKKTSIQSDLPLKDASESGSFKICTTCGHQWPTRDDFLSDPDIRIGGYQALMTDLKAGLFLFTHFDPGCKTTLGFKAETFADLYDGPIFQERMTGTDECPGHCLHESDLRPCPNQCECAFVREIIQIVDNWKKR